MNYYKIFLLSLLISSAVAANKDQWRGKTIYQLLTDRFWRTDGNTAPCKDLRVYCGGTFKGISDKLDYIKGMGFDAIWISPIPENKGQDYHGYAALDWEKINSHFGTS